MYNYIIETKNPFKIKVMLIDHDGNQVGNVSTFESLIDALQWVNWMDGNGLSYEDTIKILDFNTEEVAWS